MEEDIIQFVGLKDLSEKEEEEVNTLTNRYFDTIKREIKNLTCLKVHIKAYKEEGKRKKYSLHVQCSSPTKIFESCKAHDWDLRRALHKAFEDLIKQIQHTFHSERGYKKSYE